MAEVSRELGRWFPCWVHIILVVPQLAAGNWATAWFAGVAAFMAFAYIWTRDFDKRLQ